MKSLGEYIVLRTFVETMRILLSCKVLRINAHASRCDIMYDQ